MRNRALMLAAVCVACLAGQGAAEAAEGEALVVAQAGVLDALPAEALPKVRALAELLQQSLSKGQLNDVQIQREWQEGHLEQTIRQLGPEADRLFDELKSLLQPGRSEEALSGVLQGLAQPNP